MRNYLLTRVPVERPGFGFGKAASTIAWCAAMLGISTLPLPVRAQINQSNWGTVTSPVFGRQEPNPNYQPNAAFPSLVELFAGPGQYYDSQSGSLAFKFAPDDYFHGVLPNGRIVNPAGRSVQVGMNPLGIALTSDGRFLITSNDDERDEGFASLRNPDSPQNPGNKGGYSLSVLRTADMKIMAHAETGRFFIGLQVKQQGDGSYTIYASGGADHDLKVFTLTANEQTAALVPGPVIPITPLLSQTTNPSQPTKLTSRSQKSVSNYTPAPGLPTNALPSGFSRTGAKNTFPAGSALSPDGRYLYVACNGDNSLAVIDTTTNAVIKQIAVGYFPYSVTVSQDGSRVLVSNWGVTAYRFSKPTYDADGKLASLTSQGNVPGFFVPVTDTGGKNPKTSSISLIDVPDGNPRNARLLGAVYHGHRLDDLNQVGDTHPSASAIVRRNGVEVLYTTKTNSDSLGLTLVGTGRKLPDFDLSLLDLNVMMGGRAGLHRVHGAYPNAIVVSSDNTRAYVAEAGLNSVAVLDTTDPAMPKLRNRLPTGWYPTGLALSGDGNTLYVSNAKGMGEDINPATTDNAKSTGVESYLDSNFIFGSVQKIDLRAYAAAKDDTAAANVGTAGENAGTFGSEMVQNNNFHIQPAASLDASVVPLGIPHGARPGSPQAASRKIKHVFFILHENKAFDSMLGNQAHFGSFASLMFNNTGTKIAPNGAVMTEVQNTGVALNTQLLARTFATAVNYYSDSEESDAGHQFAASGTASDYTQKTLLVKDGRGLLVNKNMEPEDYPEGGYIFNNAARNGVSFKDYGALVRIEGTDTGTSTSTILNDSLSGFAGYPQLDAARVKNVTRPLVNKGDVADSKVTGKGSNPFHPDPQPDTPRTKGLGQSYFLNLPVLKILGDKNINGEPHLDRDYPGYNFNISDQRRAKEFIRDFDRMVAADTLPQFVYIYQPNDHTGSVQAPNAKDVGTTGLQQIADGDVGLGMVVQHILASPVYYDASKQTGCAIFITWDDAQGSLDHIHPHRTPLIVVSPYARVQTNGVLNEGHVGTRHYSTASIVKTEELLLGVPPNNLGDLFATDLRDLFQPNYNGITAEMFTGDNAFQRVVKYAPSPEGKRIWALAKHLDGTGPDRDSRRFSRLTRLSRQADALHALAVQRKHLQTAQYKATQDSLYQTACKLVRDE